MDNQPIFKASIFGGFDRQSVLNYIFELNSNAKAAQQRMNAQFDEVSAARERLSENLRALEQRLGAAEQARKTLETELESERGRHSAADAMLTTLNVEIARQKEVIFQKDAEIKRVEQLRAELEARNAELESKRDELEKSSIYIGELVVRTKLETERVLDDANAQARELVDEAARSLSGVYEQFGKFRTEMEAIEERIEDAVITMQNKFAAIGETIAASEENIRGFYRPYALTLVKDEPKPADPFADVSFFRGAAE